MQRVGPSIAELLQPSWSCAHGSEQFDGEIPRMPSQEKTKEKQLLAGYSHGTLPSCSRVEYHRRYDLSQDNTQALRIVRPKWLANKSSSSYITYGCWPYSLRLRKNTSDIKCLKEIFSRGVYTRSLKRGAKSWLDLGAHVGLFSIAAMMAGAKEVYAYEPFKPNRDLASINTKGYNVKVYKQVVQADSVTKRTIDLFVAKNPLNTWRHTALATKGRETVKVSSLGVGKVMKKHMRVDAVKMDIEGAELAILQTFKWPKRVRVLVFEYSFSRDPKVSTFKQAMRHLRQQGFRCEYAPSVLRRPSDTVYSNRDVVVHCHRP